MTEIVNQEAEKQEGIKRVRLVVAYDGTNYHGWQLQKNGKTIEGELNRCLSALLGEDIEVIGASRTDSGVHALGNIAVFDTRKKFPMHSINGCRRISAYRAQSRWHLTGILVIAAVGKPMNTAFTEANFQCL